MTKTEWLLLARYDGLPIVPADRVCKDFFAPLTLPRFLRKISDGELALPLIRLERSQKGAKGIAIVDLARYLDERHDEARRETAQRRYKQNRYD